MPSEFLFPLQADDLTECGGDRYAVEMPLDMSAMAPEELTDILEGMPRLNSLSFLWSWQKLGLILLRLF